MGKGNAVPIRAQYPITFETSFQGGTPCRWSYSGERQQSKGSSTDVILQPWIPGHSIRQHDHETHHKGLPETSGHPYSRGRRNQESVVPQQ